MVKHVRSNITPPPQEIEIKDELAFAKLPSAVQDSVRNFYGDGNAMLVAVLSRISHYDPQQQVEIERHFFAALGYATESEA